MNSGYRSTPFTALQWQELEQQALIFKYMMSGIPVPAELLLPIRKIGYYSMFGKKVDPEPGRCRRTDGKKWRCSKDAYPDSKYCERHMHRGRNRSRKPVETQNISQSSSTVTSLDSSGSRNAESFQNLPLLSIGSGASCSELDSSHLQTESNAYVMGGKDFSRYFPGQKPDADEHNFFSYSSGSERMLGLNSSVENPWLLMQSRVNSFPTSKQRNDSVFETNYPQLGMIQNVEQDTIISAIYKQQQHNLFGSEFGSVDTEKAGQALRSFLDEWPKTRSSWSDIEDDRTNRSCSSTTQLSISIPISSSDFSASSSRSPNGK